MSHYYERHCATHGEWDDDVDNPSDCPDCIKAGTTPEQLMRAENAQLRADNAELRLWLSNATVALEYPQHFKGELVAVDCRAILDKYPEPLAEVEVEQ